MKQAYAFLSAVVLAGGLTTAALPPNAAGADEPVMRGTISSIDHTSGKIELRTDKGPSRVYLAPEALKNLKAGDQVALELKTAIPNQEAYERDMEQRFPTTTKPEVDIPTKSKQVGS
jgi:hypothetical protein